ncbi:hypothetical protein F4778DRAFT_716894 [Xylariomycetidae sp. FL2044]|nr:hypothetical protein F4778DRAFT_716894 [Xylariomycetidae sp. FL2044]
MAGAIPGETVEQQGPEHHGGYEGGRADQPPLPPGHHPVLVLVLVPVLQAGRGFDPGEHAAYDPRDADDQEQAAQEEQRGLLRVAVVAPVAEGVAERAVEPAEVAAAGLVLAPQGLVGGPVVVGPGDHMGDLDYPGWLGGGVDGGGGGGGGGGSGGGGVERHLVLLMSVLLLLLVLLLVLLLLLLVVVVMF